MGCDYRVVKYLNIIFDDGNTGFVSLSDKKVVSFIGI
jgi:hypothetical protein